MNPADTKAQRLLLSREMAEALLREFDRYAIRGMVTVEVNSSGIWLIHAPTDRVCHIGAAAAREGAGTRARRMAH